MRSLLFGLSMWLDSGRNVASSKLIGRSKTGFPEKRTSRNVADFLGKQLVI